MNYEVRASDTLEGIAAAHDCTVGQLVKLNKMHSRMVKVYSLLNRENYFFQYQRNFSKLVLLHVMYFL